MGTKDTVGSPFAAPNCVLSPARSQGDRSCHACDVTWVKTAKREMENVDEKHKNRQRSEDTQERMRNQSDCLENGKPDFYTKVIKVSTSPLQYMVFNLIFFLLISNEMGLL